MCPTLVLQRRRGKNSISSVKLSRWKRCNGLEE